MCIIAGPHYWWEMRLKENRMRREQSEGKTAGTENSVTAKAGSASSKERCQRSINSDSRIGGQVTWIRCRGHITVQGKTR